MSPAQEYVELEERYQKVLAALNFWLPSVPADGSQEIIDRIASDAYLLVDYEDHNGQPDAQTLGWIELMPTIETCNTDTSCPQSEKP